MPITIKFLRRLEYTFLKLTYWTRMKKSKMTSHWDKNLTEGGKTYENSNRLENLKFRIYWQGTIANKNANEPWAILRENIVHNYLLQHNMGTIIPKLFKINIQADVIPQVCILSVIRPKRGAAAHRPRGKPRNTVWRQARFFRNTRMFYSPCKIHGFFIFYFWIVYK